MITNTEALLAAFSKEKYFLYNTGLVTCSQPLGVLGPYNCGNISEVKLALLKLGKFYILEIMLVFYRHVVGDFIKSRCMPLTFALVKEMFVSLISKNLLSIPVLKFNNSRTCRSHAGRHIFFSLPGQPLSNQ